MLVNDDEHKCSSIFYNSFSDPYFIEKILLITYAVIFVIGLVGNIMTIVIIKCNTHLRTPTNFYLLNLAISDLMILMCNLPIEMIEIHYREWPLSVIFCKLRSICAEFFTCSSILTILAFTCERYSTIVHPIHFHQLSHFRRAQKVILIIWFISLIFSVPFGFLYEIDTQSFVITSTTTLPLIDHSKILRLNETIFCKSCGPKKDVNRLLSIIIIITSFGFFYLPMIIIGAIYLFIGKALNHVNKYENASNNMKSSSLSLSNYSIASKKLTPNTSCHSIITQKETMDTKNQNTHLGSYSWLKTRARCQARKVVIKTLVAVVIAFFVCYAPLYIQRLLLAIMNLNLISDSQLSASVMAYLYIISGTTYYFGSVINPILYNVVSNKYRRAFRNLFYCRLTYKTKTTTKNQQKLFQVNRSNHQPMNYLIKTSPILQHQTYNTNKKIFSHFSQQQKCQNETLPMTKRLILSNTQSSRSNSSSISSQNREQCQTYSLHSNTSLQKKCQVQHTNGRLSLRRKLLGGRQPTDTVP
ncbi:unnamed protein product [Adineta steineri]|uniref:G-protein coupled receptors family 1 profile domain-containing protein n=1 Tax=Adineta steineri TaxID=433720 RepID=A0A818K901_9BILA|nr:unnamed protein product [Adineta steineri]CAF0726336.1 unnamed protein product [Adineta steineri]CAF0733267.1 unnamed protein product [Adineta steineri]CAF3550760.1 unnamed protein product [Adineta steineri]CAF3745585.1 unnamed protein product [Adineta steineri]